MPTTGYYEGYSIYTCRHKEGVTNTYLYDSKYLNDSFSIYEGIVLTQLYKSNKEIDVVGM